MGKDACPIYILTRNYGERGHDICGVTRNLEAAVTWYSASEESDVVTIEIGGAPEGRESWRTLKVDAKQVSGQSA